MNFSKPIFILGSHKSGTTLLRNLLSDNSMIASVPFEAHFFEFLNYWIKTEYRKQRPSINYNFEAKVIDYVNKVNITKDRKGDAFLDGRMSIDKFKKNIKAIDTKTESEKIKQYITAIFQSLSTDFSNKRLLEKSVENAEFVGELQKIFPDAKFIHILRNPYSNWVSLRKYKSIDWGFPLINRMHKNFEESYYWLEKNKRLFSNYKVVKYEDLLLDVENVMKDVALFCEIPFEQNLIKPTYLGEPWGGNSTSEKKFLGVDASQLDKWKNEILPIEANFINRSFSHIIENYGYEHFYPKGSVYKRGEGESMKRYIANRLYKFYL